MTREEATVALFQIWQTCHKLSMIRSELEQIANASDVFKVKSTCHSTIARIRATLEHKAEIAELYYAFTLEVPENVLTDRFR